ncbi:HAMP domain-containing sensor histidine kinase [Exiguobacterium acetylicum]|uniref:HAMP domain-containing sensor histidine kinase n=1 Tax=Exiguobacterium acetylicum TaxID=41170 RepID=UPI0011EC801F|nr:ATP-binding protein [Exiguobacterium acetylicum]
MKRFIRSISGRFFVILFGLLLLPLLLPFIMTVWFQFQEIDQDLNNQLQQRTDQIERLMQDQNLSFAEASQYMDQSLIQTTQYTSLNQVQLLSASERNQLQQKGEITIDGTWIEPSRYIRQMETGYLVSTPIAGQRILDGLRASAGIGIVITIGVAFILTWLAVTLVTRRIRRISEAAIEVTNGNYDVSITEGGNDEVALLVENFNHMTEALRRNDHLAKDLVASISHELKTPIASIQGFSRLLQTEENPDKRQQYLTIMEQESTRLSRLTSNLVRLSRLDHQTIIERKRYRLDEQLRTSLLLLERHWTEKSLRLELDLPEVSVEWEEELMQHVWLNLLENAIRYSPELGVLEVTLHEGKNIRITIRDEGPGIAEQDLPYVFDRFYQGEQSRANEGHGLGLSIVKRIIDLHDGELTIKNHPDQGAIVTVMLMARETRE